MIWSYGGYTSDANEAVIQVQSEELRTRFGVIYGYRRVITMTGRIVRASRSDLLTRVAALKSALAAENGTFTWKFADTTDSGESMDSTNTKGGVRVKPPSFPQGEGGEFSTFRHYVAQVEGVIAIGAGLSGNPIVEFEETIDHTNPTAGEDFEIIPLADQQWDVQNTYPYGKHTMVQSGTIVGLYAYPTVPSPVIATTPPLKKVLTKIVPRTPREILPDGTKLEFPVSYSYSYESPTPMTLYYPVIP